MGLPLKAEPTYAIAVPGDMTIIILDPSVLILTKLKRWFSTWRDNPTRPKTLIKQHSDVGDIRFMLDWLAKNGCRIEPGHYIGKPREELLGFLRAFHANTKDMAELMQAAMYEGDWVDMIALEPPVQGGDAPPSD